MAETVQKITAWSFSRLQDWRRCPRLAKYKHVDKLKEPGNEAMERGSRIDALGADFIGGKLRRCPPEVASFKAEFTELRRRKAVCQEQWAFDKGWAEVGWFDAEAWCRIKTDVYTLDRDTGVLLVVDNKTGKPRDYHLEQVKLYALGGLLKCPEAATVDARIWYTDLGLELPESPALYARADVPALKAYWEKQAGPMLADARFAPKPSGACRYCHFSRDRGGPCEY